MGERMPLPGGGFAIICRRGSRNEPQRRSRTEEDDIAEDIRRTLRRGQAQLPTAPEG